jgi:hypothetical protein
MLLFILLAVGRPILTKAADPISSEYAAALQKDTEERYKRLVADVQTILDNQELTQKHQEELRKRFEKFETEFRQSDDLEKRSSMELGRRMDYFEKKLAEVDQKRIADNKLILTNLSQLAVVPAPEPNSKPADREDGSGKAGGVYVVQKNDTLAGIVDYLRKHGHPTVTKDELRKANPKLLPDRLLIGEKIRLPSRE